ncbi:adenosylcobinamide-GDP ribazoletransferase [Salipiger mucosus]|uniref:Adenosylcobinamide-GDP ribazoletransferase n=1 Tax=Salipiger mucosus DSM 16094 TaxID=1123237 RepID=S9Q9N6_9RHOB|nr:adenosylcobinamide-GDP ribazoletransferase [Salipiger mucosus]EPX76697.1 Cobalamin synthase [Salipiger mucosus DSM 16094]
MSLGHRVDEARLALAMLSRLPVGRLRDPAPGLGQASWAYPLAGLPLGLIGWAVLHAALAIGLAPLAAALLCVLAMVMATGALHHDGLADFADGIWGGHDRARRLEIMRDSRIGSYGVIALALALGLEAAALGQPHAPSLATFLLVAVASRLAMLALLLRLPPARSDGLGHMTTQASPAAILPGALLVLALAFGAGPASPVILAVMALPPLIVARLAMRRLGGQTGDVLGAAQLVAEVAGWLAWSALLAGPAT